MGRTKRVLNLENTRNISCALRAVASLSRSREMIWFSILATRSLYAVSAVYQISEPSAACQHRKCSLCMATHPVRRRERPHS